MHASTLLWRHFYDTAAQFRDLAPWRWMYDSQIFGVQNPETGETAWCCVMGNAGEHYALAVYRGTAGLHSYYRLAAAGDYKSPFNPEYFNVMFNQNCLMVSFEDAQTTPPEQKAHLKALGLSFRGAGQWIVANTYDPGMQPWLVPEEELPWFILCMEQAMDVARRCQGNPELLEHGNKLLVRVSSGATDASVWEDRYYAETALPPPPPTLPVLPSKAFIKQVQSLPLINGAVAIANFMTSQAVQEHKKKRPWHPSLLLCIEPGSGYVLAQDMVAYHELPGRLEKFLLGVFKAVNGKPRQIGVHHEPMAQWLEKIAEATGIDIILLSGDAPFFTDVVEALSGIFRN